MSLSTDCISSPAIDAFWHMSSVAFGIESFHQVTSSSIGIIKIKQPTETKSDKDKVLSIFFLKAPIYGNKTKSIYAATVKLADKDTWDKFAWVRSSITPKILSLSQNELFDQAAEADLSLKRKYLTADHEGDFLQPFAFYGDLLQMLSNADDLTNQTLIFISRQCINLIEKLHALGIYHRDIKPENFLVDYDEGLLKVYINGFKFATKVKKSTEILGSDHYCSLDHKLSTEINLQQSDIFSLGLTLYTLCTRQFFLRQKDPLLLELERNPLQNWFKIEDEYKKIIHSSPLIPPPLKEIIVLFLKIHPMDRLSLKESLKFLSQF
jgi:hypothetical protein